MVERAYALHVLQQQALACAARVQEPRQRVQLVDGAVQPKAGAVAQLVRSHGIRTGPQLQNRSPRR